MRAIAKGKRAFRPGLEEVERRALTASAGLGFGHGARGAVLALRESRAEALSQRFQAPEISALNRRPPVGRPRPGPGATLPIGPGLGRGLVRLTIPLNYVDYGVATLWNNTTTAVSFGVSASTYANGQYFTFALNPGEYRSIYATYTATGQAPTIKVAINPNYPPVTLSQLNTVFEKPNWVPTGTEGRPFAINVGVNGLYLSEI